MTLTYAELPTDHAVETKEVLETPVSTVVERDSWKLTPEEYAVRCIRNMLGYLHGEDVQKSVLFVSSENIRHDALMSILGCGPPQFFGDVTKAAVRTSEDSARGVIRRQTVVNDVLYESPEGVIRRQAILAQESAIMGTVVESYITTNYTAVRSHELAELLEFEKSVSLSSKAA